MMTMSAEMAALVVEAEANGWERVRRVVLTDAEQAASDAGDTPTRDGSDLWLLAQTADACEWGVPDPDGDAIMAEDCGPEAIALAARMVEAGGQIMDDSYVSMTCVIL